MHCLELERVLSLWRLFGACPTLVRRFSYLNDILFYQLAFWNRPGSEYLIVIVFGLTAYPSTLQVLSQGQKFKRVAVRATPFPC